MDFTLSENQRMLVDGLHSLCEEEIKPYYDGHQFMSEGSFDWHLIRLLGKKNLICPTIPAKYGGLGLDIVTTALLMEEISSYVPSLAAIIETNIHSIQPILLAGTDAQKKLIFSDCIGENTCLLAYALTEPTGGSSLKSMYTFAEKTTGGYIINGYKSYILNAPEAKYILLFAFTDQLHKKSSLRCFIVPTGTPGVKIDRECQLNTLDYARISNIAFDNVFIPDNLVLKNNEPYSGYFLLHQTMDIGKALIAAASVGMASAAYNFAFSFAREREIAGKSIFQFQSIAHSFADMATKIEMARLLTWKACWLIDSGEDFAVASSMAKLAASRTAQEIGACAMDIIGAAALVKGTPMERLWNDIRMLSIVEGTNNLQKDIIAGLL